MSATPSPDIHSPAQGEFETASRAAGYDPADPWIGGYVDYEWNHLRLMLENYGLAMTVDGRPARVLEFGCNVAASSVVMATLGAQVTAIDIDAQMIRIARANAERYGLTDRIAIHHVKDTRTLPFSDASFDVVIANSVLEYVADDYLDAIIAELGRVSAPNAQMLVCGTASRLSPKEVHSGRWLVNYVPRFLDTMLYGKSAQRGLAPWRLARAARPYFADVTGEKWASGRQRIHGRLSPAMQVVRTLARLLGISPGWLSPNIEALLRRAG
jgi:SAM-dependent methyltransferase